MTRKTENARNRGFRYAVIAGAIGAVALGVMAAPALAETLGYYYEQPVTVYTPPPTTTTTTYTYTSPPRTYTYVEPAPPPPPTTVYERPARGPGLYLDTPILNFGIGF